MLEDDGASRAGADPVLTRIFHVFQHSLICGGVGERRFDDGVAQRLPAGLPVRLLSVLDMDDQLGILLVGAYSADAFRKTVALEVVLVQGQIAFDDEKLARRTEGGRHLGQQRHQPGARGRIARLGDRRLEGIQIGGRQIVLGVSGRNERRQNQKHVERLHAHVRLLSLAGGSRGCPRARLVIKAFSDTPPIRAAPVRRAGSFRNCVPNCNCRGSARR
jgi:hypothetical protein